MNSEIPKMEMKMEMDMPSKSEADVPSKSEADGPSKTEIPWILIESYFKHKHLKHKHLRWFASLKLL